MINPGLIKTFIKEPFSTGIVPVKIEENSNKKHVQIEKYHWNLMVSIVTYKIG